MEFTTGWTLAILGIFLLCGYLAYVTAAFVSLPRVTLLLLTGIILGPSVLDVIPGYVSTWFPLVSQMALAMVGFLLGERFVGRDLKERGMQIVWISVGKTLAAALSVFIFSLVLGAPLVLALVLAGIAPATAPAAIYETVKETRAKGPLADSVLGVVAIDDAWGVILFSVVFMVAGAVSEQSTSAAELLAGIWEVAGAILLGIVIGLLMAWITSHVREGEATLVEAAGFVLFCAGVAILLQLSYLLACMSLGAVVANRGSARRKPFHILEGIREPFLALFFLLAGFRFDLGTLKSIGTVSLGYVLARSVGLIAGSTVSSIRVGAPQQVRKRLGWCTLPQAGVALGLALLVRERMPQYGEEVLNLVIASTVIFELLGPPIARHHLISAGESKRAGTKEYRAWETKK